MTDFNAYWNPNSVGGDGTTAALTGANAAYASLASAELNEQRNLVTPNDTLKLNGAGNSTADTTAATFSGWTLSATNRVTIEGDNTGAVWDETKAHMKVNGRCISLLDSFVTVKNMQLMSGTTGANDQAGVEITNTGGHIITDNIMRLDVSAYAANADRLYGVSEYTSSGSLPDGNVIIANNIIYDYQHGTFTFTGRGIYVRQSDALGNIYAIYNNTVVNCQRGIWARSTIGTSALAKNNIVQDCVADYYDTGFDTVNSATNLSSDATAPGVSAITSTALTFANKAADDFRLDSTDTAAIGAGTDLSADSVYSFSVDIEDDTRPTSAWDVGADEYVAAGGVHNLTVANVGSNVGNESLAITQVQQLSVADIASTVGNESLTITQVQQLSVADIASTVGNESPTITQVQQLSVADIASNGGVDVLAVTQTAEHTLAVANIASTVGVDSPAITQVQQLSVANTGSPVAIEQPSIAQVHQLSVADIASNVAVDSFALVTGVGLGLIDQPITRSVTVHMKTESSTQFFYSLKV